MWSRLRHCRIPNYDQGETSAPSRQRLNGPLLSLPDGECVGRPSHTIPETVESQTASDTGPRVIRFRGLQLVDQWARKSFTEPIEPDSYRCRVDQNEREYYGSSFGAAAAAYNEHRPDYSQEAVRWALEPAPGSRVLDLGAGTGKLTTVLAAFGAEVIAVEPDPAMLARLRQVLPTIRALAGSAEAIPLQDGSVDAVVAGNALHWFNMDVAGPEIARVLVPGGILAGLWNIFDDRVEWVAQLDQVAGKWAIGARDTLSRWRLETSRAHLPNSELVPNFGSPEQVEFSHGQRRTADSLVQTFATKAGILVMPEPEREVILDRIRSFLASRPETAVGEFNLPMMTGVLRVERL
jgi:SAM-dependent methyltransferase